MSHEDIDIVRAWKDEKYRNSLRACHETTFFLFS